MTFYYSLNCSKKGFVNARPKPTLAYNRVIPHSANSIDADNARQNDNFRVLYRPNHRTVTLPCDNKPVHRAPSGSFHSSLDFGSNDPVSQVGNLKLLEIKRFTELVPVVLTNFISNPFVFTNSVY